VPIGKTGALRFATRIKYRGRPSATIDVELAVAEPPADLELVPAIDIATFGLHGPERVAALSVRYQLAQKFHAVSQRFETGENKRIRDIVDILLMRGIVGDITDLHAACVSVFATRATHSWPPTITVYDSWPADHAKLCRQIGFTTTDIHQAVAEVHQFIAEIDRAGPTTSDRDHALRP